MSFLSKVLYRMNPNIGSWDILLVRGVVSTVVIFLKMKSERVDIFGFNNYGGSLLAGTIFAACCYFFCILSYQFVSVTKATLIIYSNPLVVVIIGYFFLSENVTRYDLFSLAMVIGGCFMMTRNNGDSTEEFSNPTLGYIFATISCISMGCSITFMRRTNQVMHHLMFVFYMSIIMLFISLFVMEFTPLINFAHYGIIELILLVCITAGGMVGLIFSGLAVKYVEASKLGPFWNLEVVILCILEFLLLDYQFALTDLIGGFFIIGAILLTITVQQNTKPKNCG